MICPLCNRQYKKEQFQPYGPSKRPFVACPNCFSSDRERLACLFILKPGLPLTKVLHLAPEKKIHSLLKKKAKHYVCGDIEPQQYRSMQCIYLDATNIPIPNNTVDFVYASHILEHIVDDKKAMSEIYRILNDNGTLLAMVPQHLDKDTTFEDETIVDPKERLRHFGQDDHVRIYGLDFSQRLKDSGFIVEIYCHISMQHTIEKMCYDKKYFFDQEVENYNLNKNEILYVCKK